MPQTHDYRLSWPFSPSVMIYWQSRHKSARIWRWME